MPSNPPSERSRAVQLGAELKAVRQSAKLTLKQVGTSLGRDHSTVSRWESGTYKPNLQDTAAYLAILGVTGEERERILELARHDGLADWIAPGISHQLAVLMEYQRLASKITEVNSHLIPGLVQTREYARTIMLAGGMTKGEAEGNSAVRLGRQDVLTRRKSPADYVAFLGASALLFPPCADDTMDEQLDHLLVMADRPNISIRIVPQRRGIYSPIFEGPFAVLDLAQDRPVVQIQSYHATSIVTNRKSVDRYLAAITEIGLIALTESETARFLKEMKEKQGR